MKTVPNYDTYPAGKSQTLLTNKGFIDNIRAWFSA